MNLRHALWSLAEGANLPSVDRLGDRQRIHVIEGLPAKSKEFAGAERIGHVQHQQDAIPLCRRVQYRSQLFPGQNLFVLRLKILGNLQCPGRILDQKLLLDCFIEDGLGINQGRVALRHCPRIADWLPSGNHGDVANYKIVPHDPQTSSSHH